MRQKSQMEFVRKGEAPGTVNILAAVQIHKKHVGIFRKSPHALYYHRPNHVSAAPECPPFLSALCLFRSVIVPVMAHRADGGDRTGIYGWPICTPIRICEL